jgi:hypothetical protein
MISPRRARGHNLAPMHPCTWADIEHVIRLADGFFVMFDHDHRIALIAQVFQRIQQAGIVALMQTNRGFIKHIKNPREARADLAGQTDALAFTPRQGARIADSVR